MKNFKFDLNAKVAIYVPSTTDVNVPTDNKKFVNKAMTKFSEWFGGCTSTPAVGGWVSALCETGRVPGRVDRNIEAGTAVYFPGGGAAEVMESPEDCARVLNEYFL